MLAVFVKWERGRHYRNLHEYGQIRLDIFNNCNLDLQSLRKYILFIKMVVQNKRTRVAADR